MQRLQRLMVAFRLNFSSYLFFFASLSRLSCWSWCPSLRYCLHSSCSLCFLPLLPLFFIDLQCFIPRVPQFIFNRGYFLSAGMKRPDEQLGISLRLTRAFYAWAARWLPSVWTKTHQSFEPPPHSPHCRQQRFLCACVFPQHTSIRAGMFSAFIFSAYEVGHRPPLWFPALSSVSHRAVATSYVSAGFLAITPPHTPMISFSGSSLCQSLEVNIGRRSPPLWVGQEVLFHTVAPALVFVLCHHSFSFQVVLKAQGGEKALLHSKKIAINFFFMWFE